MGARAVWHLLQGGYGTLANNYFQDFCDEATDGRPFASFGCAPLRLDRERAIRWSRSAGTQLIVERLLRGRQG
jgi:hypothetical protein